MKKLSLLLLMAFNAVIVRGQTFQEAAGIKLKTSGVTNLNTQSNTDVNAPFIYKGSLGSSFPFSDSNHLILQGAPGREIVLSTGSTNSIAYRLRIASNGKVGLGDTLYNSKLTVNGNVNIGGGSFLGYAFTDTFHLDGVTNPQPNYGLRWAVDPWYTAPTLLVSGYGGMKFFTASKARMAITSAGYVGINTTSPTSELSVNGTVTAKKLKVTQSGWADFVFAPEYELPSLAATEAYVKAHRHLPGVPDAATVEKEGQDLGEMNRILLQKLEELTLHLIQQQKEIEELKALIKK
ncbi:hypothetical protein SIO70_31470 [Chitinophaga sancti]|uniref:hypothetical protein n=1 Tax=Chitinophaga sancti TaxID=1004 RepID=UPI002A74F159|nr:hypothetical protein [Chitinophaga sancti]WPQ62884.1 hypothetical protein SIO70_31470 [Chitinophaga sancti]